MFSASAGCMSPWYFTTVPWLGIVQKYISFLLHSDPSLGL